MTHLAGGYTSTALRALKILLPLAFIAQNQSAEDLERDPKITGQHGGWLRTAQRAEPKTFNPLTAIDTASRDVIGRLHADLIHINRRSLQTGPGLAASWRVSPDGRLYTLNLRRGIRFSDGHPMDADDVVFTFTVYLDDSIPSAQRDLLVVQGKPIQVRKIGTHTVQFELASPYASAERLFDSVPILPRHRLFKAYQEGRLARTWGIETPPDQIVGLGPFRLKEFVPGQRVILERNPYYWRADRNGRRLPFLEGLAIEFLPNEEIQTMRFAAGGLSLISPLTAANFAELNKLEKLARVRAYDAGPGLEYQFLVFNMNDQEPGKGSEVALKQGWFRDLAFRRAVSTAIDREAIARLVYRGLAEPIWGHVTPGNALWKNQAIPRTPRSISKARAILAAASFSWKDGKLFDPKGNLIEFTILVSSSNAQKARVATVVQDDLRQLGMKVGLVSLEFRTMLDRIFNRVDYDAAVMSVDSGDADPNSEMNVWVSGGNMHLWNLNGKPQTSWEEDIDRLMRRQMITLDLQERKRIYDRVQQLVAEHLPVIFLASPHVLVGASAQLGNFEPSILRPNALWNAEALYFREKQ
jgi:peptide/nickel transport system substrate-binding protein